MKEKLDEEKVERISVEIMEIIRANFKAGPSDRMRVYENLNALAIAVGTIIAGTGSDPIALEFFLAAMGKQIHEAIAELKASPD